VSERALVVPRAEFSIEDPWQIPPGCASVPLHRATDGAAPRLATQVAAYHDGAVLTIVYVAEDDAEVVATMYGHDEPLWKEDVVELFIAPDGLTPYYELEISPIGTTFDARIDSPGGIRATMVVDLDWNADDLFAAVKRDGGTRMSIVLRLPFAALGATPQSGDEWRANFFRVDRSAAHGDEYSAWQPTLKSPPDFHVAAAFGVLRFA
jgi:hypothetical protein